jgi:TrmH family RNA methyltransferase
MLTSVQNPKVKWAKELNASARARREEGLFVVEGVRLAEEALASGWQARWVVYGEGLSPRGRVVVDGFAAQGAELDLAAGHVLKAISDTEAPQGVLAVMARRDLPIPPTLSFAVIVDKLRDPGNLGTILRTAAAAGVQALFCSPETADAFAPKVVRAGMGAHFRLPIRALAWEALAEMARPLSVYESAVVEQALPYTQADFTLPLALLIGAEAEGVSQAGRALATGAVHIPMPGGSESLNAAVAAAVLMFEVVRQRGEAR